MENPMTKYRELNANGSESDKKSLVPKYRLGRKNKRVILETETGHEYLTFPQSKTEHIKEFLNWLNSR